MFTKRNYLVGIIIFVMVWVLILAIPRTRLLLNTQYSRIYPLQQIDFFPSEAQITVLQKLARQRPDDAKVQSFLVQSGTLGSRISMKNFTDGPSNFDDLIRRFPNDKQLLLDRMRASLAGGFSSPKGSYFLDYNDKHHYFRHGPDWLSPTQRKQMLKMALLGEHKDPHNTFYNWVEAICWYDFGENDKALDALYRGSQKTNYDDGNFQDIRDHLYVQKLMMPTLVEDRWLTVACEVIPLGIMRQANQVAIWQGAMQEKAGNHQRALEIYGAQMRLAALLNKNSKLLLGQAVVHGMLITDYMGLTRWTAADLKKYYEATPQGEEKIFFLLASQRFAKYAKSHGRADLASEALATANPIKSDLLYTTHIPDAYTFLSPTELKHLGLLKWTGVLLLNFTLIGIALFACFFVFLALLQKITGEKLARKQIPIRYSDTIISSLFVLICAGVCVGIILSQISDRRILYFVMMTPRFPNIGFLSNLDFIIEWIPWFSFALLFFYCLLPSSWKMRKSTFAPADSKGARFADGALVFAGKIFLWLVFLPVELLWTLLIISQFANGTHSTIIEFCFYLTIPLPLILFLLFIYWTKHRQTSPPQFSAAAYWMCSFKMLRNSIALLILICSVAYGATSFASLPMRIQANAALDQFMKVGEVDFFRQRVEQNKAEYTDDTE